MFKEIRVQFFASDSKKKLFNSLRHIQRLKVSILWVKLNNSNLWVLLKRKSILEKRFNFFESYWKKINSLSQTKRFNSLSHHKKSNSLDQSWEKFNSLKEKKKGAILSAVFLKGSILWVILKKEVQFFESYEKKNQFWDFFEKKVSFFLNCFSTKKFNFWVTFKKWFRFFESYSKKKEKRFHSLNQFFKKSNPLTHIQKDGSILWVMFKKRFNSWVM